MFFDTLHFVQTRMGTVDSHLVLFMMIAIVTLLKDISEKFKLKYLIPIYMMFVIAFFIIYYPVISGSVVDINYLEKVKIFNSWYF